MTGSSEKTILKLVYTFISILSINTFFRNYGPGMQKEYGMMVVNLSYVQPIGVKTSCCGFYYFWWAFLRAPSAVS